MTKNADIDKYGYSGYGIGFDRRSSLFISRWWIWSKGINLWSRYFEEDGTQNYLVFQPLNKYFKVIANTDYVSSWKSKGLSAENIKPPTTFDNSLTPIVPKQDKNLLEVV